MKVCDGINFPAVLNKNLFASSDAMLTKHTLVCRNYGGQAVAAPPKAITEGYIQISTETSSSSAAQPQGRAPGFGRVRASKTFQLQRNSSSEVISLGDAPYLINELELQGYPNMPSFFASDSSTVFSYAIHVSRDKHQWLQLVNYAQFNCSSTQRLCFPTQAARYLC